MTQPRGLRVDINIVFTDLLNAGAGHDLAGHLGNDPSIGAVDRTAA